MSDSSDLPDSSHPDDHFPPNEPFDPKEHFESLEPEHPAPLESEGHEIEDKPPFPTYVPSQASAASGNPAQRSHARGIGAALLVGALMVGAAIGIAVVSGLRFTPPPATAPASTSSTNLAEEAKTPTGLATTSTTNAADDTKAPTAHVDAGKTENEGFARRLDEIEKQIASMPKPEPAADIKSLHTKVEGLARRVETAPASDPKAIEEKVEKAMSGHADLLTKLNAVTARTEKIEKDLEAKNSEVAALDAKVKTLSEVKPNPESAPPATATPAAAATPSAAIPNAETDAEFTQAVNSFKKSQFAQANDRFAKLQESMPNDARVWYYSAMANGFATSQWRGETEQRVRKGMELEKAGKPDATKINAAFADLPASSKGWLDAYRGQVSR